MEYWQLTREVAVDALSLEVLKTRLDGTLSKLVKWKVPMTWSLELEDF